MPDPPVIGLLTDFGPGSEHVGAMHAVIVARLPAAVRVDLAHDVPPGEVRWGAVQLARLASLLPAAVVVAVVDPGVGTSERRPLAVRLRTGGALVGPDNGLLGPAAALLGAEFAVEIAVERVGGPVSTTFHGRDVFAPVAAMIAAGTDLVEVGDEVPVAGIRSPVLTPPVCTPGHLVTEVLGADRFGNLTLVARTGDLTRAGLVPGALVDVDIGGVRHDATVARAFADVPTGALLVHGDSHGHVAVAVNMGDAAARLGAGPGRVCRIAMRALTPAVGEG